MINSREKQLAGVRRAISHLQGEKVEVDLKINAVKIIIKIIQKVLESPSDMKFRTIKASNSSLRKNLLLDSSKGPVFENLLVEAGFIKFEGYFFLTPSSDLDDLKEVCLILESFLEDLSQNDSKMLQSSSKYVNANSDSNSPNNSNFLFNDGRIKEEKDDLNSIDSSSGSSTATSRKNLQKSNSKIIEKSNKHNEKIFQEKAAADIESLRLEQQGRYTSASNGVYTVRGIVSEAGNNDENSLENSSNSGFFGRFFGSFFSSSSSNNSKKNNSSSNNSSSSSYRNFNHSNSRNGRICTMQQIRPTSFGRTGG